MRNSIRQWSANANHAPEEAADAIDRLSLPYRRQDASAVLDADGEPVLVPPEAITIDMITRAVEGTEIAAWIIHCRNRCISAPPGKMRLQALETWSAHVQSLIWGNATDKVSCIHGQR
jgi:hypothetical protein